MGVAQIVALANELNFICSYPTPIHLENAQNKNKRGRQKIAITIILTAYHTHLRIGEVRHTSSLSSPWLSTLRYAILHCSSSALPLPLTASSSAFFRSCRSSVRSIAPNDGCPNIALKKTCKQNIISMQPINSNLYSCGPHFRRGPI